MAHKEEGAKHGEKPNTQLGAAMIRSEFGKEQRLLFPTGY